jgi:hypothetical protein
MSLLWLFDVGKLLNTIQSKEPMEQERILAQIHFSKLIVDILGVTDTDQGETAGVQPPPSLVLSFQGANPSTDEAKVETEETRLQAQHGAYSWNMNFTFDVAIEEPLVLEVTLERQGQAIGSATVWLHDLEDQQKHSVTYGMKSAADPSVLAGNVSLNLLWLYDLRKLLKNTSREL